MGGAHEILWTPSPEQAKASRMQAFLDRHGFADYAAAWRWSVDDRAAFWAAMWEELELVGVRGDATLVDGDRMPGAHWFPGASISFAENLLRFTGEAPALISWNENGRGEVVSRDALRAQVAAAVAGLRQHGVGPGDRVAAYMPNLPQTVVAMLATNAIGAIWSSCSPDFGVTAALDRLNQIGPKVLLSTDAVLYAGKMIDLRDRVAAIREGLPGLELHLHVEYRGEARQEGCVPWSQLLAGHVGAALNFNRGPFERPAFILYSSGTTGLPKCIVHGAGGTLIQHAKEHALHCDLGEGDRLFYYTTTGWMMWNWLVSGLARGATLLLYDGSPFHPERDILWQMAESERIAVFGTSAKYLAMLEKRDISPRTRDLSALRAVLSTGSPLLPASFDYVYREIKSDLQLSSISGGTDLISCFALGNPLLPVRREELQCRGLGMSVEAWSESGEPAADGVGELVCTKAFPSMPVSFWDDPDGARYRAAYFERFPGVWHHGDRVQLTGHGGMVFLGRSDATLNPGGVRIGTAEIYRVVERIDEVIEGVVIGEPWEGDVRVVLFVRLAEGVELDQGLEEKIRTKIRAEASPHHVPRVIRAVPDIPRTVSGKIAEIAVRKAVMGEEIENLGALANPEALEWFREKRD